MVLKYPGSGKTKEEVNINTLPNLIIHISEGRMQEDAKEVCISIR